MIAVVSVLFFRIKLDKEDIIYLQSQILQISEPLAQKIITSRDEL